MTALDGIADQLREWRLAAGSPSFTELARRVGVLRAGAAGPTRHHAPGRVTVYDCFRDGRSRIDVELVVDLARALGVHGAELAAWQARCAEAMRPPRDHGLVTATTVLPSPAEPGVDTAAEHVHGHRVLLAGMGGSGKTQAALRLLARWRREGRVEHVLSLRIDGPAATNGAVVHAATDELGLPLTSDPADTVARLLQRLERTRTALLIDDLASAEQVRPLLAHPSEVPVVATSRQALAIPELERLDLALWSAAKVTAYLEAVVGVDRTAAEPRATRALAELTAGLPLVAALVAARVRASPEWSLWDHAAALQERRAGDRVEDAVRVCLDATLDGLSPAARDLLRTLASGPRTGMRLATLGAASIAPVPTAVAELQDAYLLGRGDERHRLHDVARGYARSRATDEEPPSVRTGREDLLLDRMCAEAWGVGGQLSPSDVESRRFSREPVEVAAPHAWLSEDLPGAMELAFTARGRRPEATVELAEALGTAVVRAGLSALSDRLHTEAREVALLMDDPLAEVRARCALATTAVRNGRNDVSLAELDALATRTGDDLALIRLGNLRGIVAMREGRQEEGLTAFRAAYDLAQTSARPTLLPAMANNLAQVLAGAGEVEESLAWAYRAVAAARESGHRGMVGQGLATLSWAQRLVGQYADASTSARAAIVEAELAGEVYALVNALCELGESLTCAGDPAQALEQFHRAEAIAGDRGLDAQEAALHNGVGSALLALGDRAGASQRFHAALAGQHDSPLEPATALHQLGRLAMDTDPARARDLFEQALGVLGDGFDQAARRIRDDLALVTARA